MEIILDDAGTYILRFDVGEDVIDGVGAFCAMHDISAAHFTAIGSTDDVTLSYYDISVRGYMDEKVEDQMEIVSLNGNVALRDDEVFVHAHGCFSDASMYTRAGHVKRCVVSATCEVTLTALNGIMERSYDNKTGLDILA